MDFFRHVCRGPVKSEIVYTVPNHPYLSLRVQNERELDVDMGDISEEMAVSSGTLTAEDLFHTRGLTFRDDSLLWAALAGKNLDDAHRRDLPSVRAKRFLELVNGLCFYEDTSEFYQILSRSAALSHFVVREYVVDGERRDTLAAHFNRLLELLDALFLQLMTLRNGNDSDIVAQAFDLLPYPKDWTGDLRPPNSTVLERYIEDETFVAFAERATFITALLCHCDRCRYGLFVRAVRHLRCGRERKVSAMSSVSDVADFDPEDLILGGGGR